MNLTAMRGAAQARAAPWRHLATSLTCRGAAPRKVKFRMRNWRRLLLFGVTLAALTWLGFAEPRLAALGALALALLLFAWAIHSSLK